MAKIELSVLQADCLKRHIAKAEKSESEAKVWESIRNVKKASVNRQFKTKDAGIKLKKIIPEFEFFEVLSRFHPNNLML